MAAVLVGVPGVTNAPILFVRVVVERAGPFWTVTRDVALGWGLFHALGRVVALRVLGFQLVFRLLKAGQVDGCVSIRHLPAAVLLPPSAGGLRLVCSFSESGVHGVFGYTLESAHEMFHPLGVCGHLSRA